MTAHPVIGDAKDTAALISRLLAQHTTTMFFPGRRVRGSRWSVGDTLTDKTAITLDEEEISDVSLSTFYVFDHENQA